MKWKRLAEIPISGFQNYETVVFAVNCRQAVVATLFLHPQH